MSAEQIAGQFAQTYYQTLDSNRPNIAGLFHDAAMLTFEGKFIQGKAAIAQHFEGLPFQRIQHVVTTVDAQPIDQSSMIVAVSGQLKTDDDPPHNFSETFVLRSFPPALLVTNDLFRLGLHNFG